MKTLSILVTTLLALLLQGCASNPYTSVDLVAASSYSTPGWVYAVNEQPKNVGIVFLHGKRGNPGLHHNDLFIARIRAQGYPVIAPVMPWSERNYKGTRTQGMEIIDRAIEQLGTDKVVVIGHSMGGMAVLQYGSGRVSPRVVGLISVAPGHDPNNADKLRRATEDSAAKACTMQKQGMGKKFSNFAEMNAGKRYTIYASAEYYCTHYHINEYPDSLLISAKIKTPTFLLSGGNDRLTHIYSHNGIYANLPDNSMNKHEILPGGHLDVLYKHTDTINRWIENL
ncbi:MAG: alpha/beta hydrolase [Gammaproteobacteria bacterium]|nr:alpha/beta hydrolase [Gammaproteobacteria bacterium]